MAIPGNINVTDFVIEIAKTGDTNGDAANGFVAAVYSAAHAAASKCLKTSLRSETLASNIVNTVIEKVVRRIATGQMEDMSEIRQYLDTAISNQSKNETKSASRKKNQLVQVASQFDKLAGSLVDSDSPTDENAVELFESYLPVIRQAHGPNHRVTKVVELELAGLKETEIATRLSIHSTAVKRATETAHSFFESWMNSKARDGKD